MLILPETESHAGRQVAQRISDRLKEDTEKPALTVSTGTAIYPQDGSTVEELLGAADRDLYTHKGSRKKKLRASN